MPATKAMTVAELKKSLRALSYEQMEGMLCSLYKNSKDVSRYFNIRFNGVAYAPKLLEDFRRDIDRSIPMDFNRPLHMAQARKSLADFQKAATDAATHLEMLLYFSERCALFTDTYGDIDAPFYDCASKAFAAFVDGLNAQEDDSLFEQWCPRIDDVLSMSRHIGWGFGDEVASLSVSIVWREQEE